MPYWEQVPCSAAVQFGQPAGSWKYRTMGTEPWDGTEAGRANIFHAFALGADYMHWSEPCERWVRTHPRSILNGAHFGCYSWDPFQGAYWYDPGEDCPDWEGVYSEQFEEEDEDLPLGVGNGVAHPVQWMSQEDYLTFIRDHSKLGDFPNLPNGFNEVNHNGQWLASSLALVDVHSRKMNDVAPVLYGVSGTEPQFLGLTITTNGAVSLEHLNIVVANQKAIADSLVLMHRQLADLMVWANQMNVCLAQRNEHLAQLLDVLGASLHGEGWYDRLQASAASGGEE